MSGSLELNLAALKSEFVAQLATFSPGMLVAAAGRPGSGIERLLDSLTVSDMDSLGFPVRLERMDWHRPWNERRDAHTERLMMCRDWADEVGGLIVFEGAVHRQVEHRGSTIDAFRPKWNDLPRTLARNCDGAIFVFHPWWYAVDSFAKWDIELIAMRRAFKPKP